MFVSHLFIIIIKITIITIIIIISTIIIIIATFFHKRKTLLITSEKIGQSCPNGGREAGPRGGVYLMNNFFVYSIDKNVLYFLQTFSHCSTLFSLSRRNRPSPFDKRPPTRQKDHENCIYLMFPKSSFFHLFEVPLIHISKLKCC